MIKSQYSQLFFTKTSDNANRCHEVILNAEGLPDTIQANDLFDPPASKLRREMPKRLRKYFICNRQSVDALLHHYLWAAHSQTFNDPFDCSPLLWNLKNFSKADLSDDYYSFFPDRDSINKRSTFFDTLCAFIGLICLNDENNENDKDQFWAHYTENHAGFAVVFETVKLINDMKQKPVKIDYVDQLETQKLFYDKEKFLAQALRWVTIKKRSWKNENEWRFVFYDIPLTEEPVKCPSMYRKREYDKFSIAKIVLGCKFFKNDALVKLSDEIYNYDFYVDNDSDKREMVRFLSENKDLSLFWNFFNDDTLQLVEVGITLEIIGWNKLKIEIKKELNSQCDSL